MSFHIDDKELLAHAQKGAKVVGGAPAKPVAPKPPPPEDPLLKEVRSLAAAIAQALNRPQPAPVVHIQPPHITLNPELKRDHPRKLKIEVTERDNTYERRIKCFEITVIE